jgi:hypothetical protein
MNVKVTELRAISDRLFAYLEESGRDEFEVSDDYYWAISKEELYDPSKDPKDLTIGQLSDDWNELTAILNEESPPIGYALVWLSAILRNIGDKAVY